MTVRELKNKLEEFDENAEIDLYMSCYEGRNYAEMKRSRYIDKDKSLEICVYEQSGLVRIENNNCDEIELSYDY